MPVENSDNDTTWISHLNREKQTLCNQEKDHISPPGAEESCHVFSFKNVSIPPLHSSQLLNERY